MTIDEARTWLQRHADNTPMPGAREAYKTILDDLNKTCQNIGMQHMEWMLAHPWMVFWLEALAIICTAETVQVVATLGERKAMHKAVLAIVEMKKLEMRDK